MKLTLVEHQNNAADFIAMSDPDADCTTIDRGELAKQMRYTNADLEDVETIASLIETMAQKRMLALYDMQ